MSSNKDVKLKRKADTYARMRERRTRGRDIDNGSIIRQTHLMESGEWRRRRADAGPSE